MTGQQTPPIEEIAAEIIAADVATTSVAGRYAKSTTTLLVLPDRTWRPWIWAAIGLIGVLVLVGGGLALGLGGGPSPSPTAVATPTGQPTSSPTPVPTPSPVTPAPTPSPPPPITGSSGGIAEFERVSGICQFAEEFSSPFDVVAQDGVLTMTQLPIEHVTTGTISRTGTSDAEFATAAAGQSYEGTIAGNMMRGTHLYTADGCDEEYSFTLKLFRPFVAEPPLGDAPAHFEFLDPSGPSFDLPIGQPARIVVTSPGVPVISDLLPIRVVLTVGDQTPWDFLIGDTADEVCVEPTTCFGDAPVFAEPGWFAAGERPVLIAYDPAGNVVAVFAPNGLP